MTFGARSAAEGIADQLTRDLAAAASPELAVSERAYLKSSLEHLGASVPQIRAAAKAVLATYPDLSHDELITLVVVLWADPVHERRMAAVELLVACGALLGTADLSVVEGLVRDSRTWALVDNLAGTVAGRIVEVASTADPVVGRTLDRWSRDPDFWVRRSALLALLPGLRRGTGDLDRFFRFADEMLEEREFFIRKVIGWVLRETAKRRPFEVREWLAGRTDRIAGLTLREAVKYLAPPDQVTLLAAYQARAKT